MCVFVCFSTHTVSHSRRGCVPQRLPVHYQEALYILFISSLLPLFTLKSIFLNSAFYHSISSAACLQQSKTRAHTPNTRTQIGLLYKKSSSPGRARSRTDKPAPLVTFTSFSPSSIWLSLSPPLVHEGARACTPGSPINISALVMDVFVLLLRERGET